MKKTGSLENALKKYARSDNKIVRVGFIDDATYSDGTLVALIAFWNEYGTEKIPPRPFFRHTIAANKSKWVKDLSKLATMHPKETALAIMGEIIQGDFRQAIISWTETPNSEVTALLKSRFPANPAEVTGKDYYEAVSDVKKGITGGNNRNPLVWSGQMIQSILYEVDDES